MRAMAVKCSRCDEVAIMRVSDAPPAWRAIHWKDAPLTVEDKEREIDLCPSCSDEFDRFMEGR